MIIGIDLDNVLSQTDEVIRAIISRLTGHSFDKSKVVTFSYATAFGINQRYEQDALNEFHLHHCGEVLPIEGAQEAVARLRQLADVRVLTSRPATVAWATNRWLERYFPHLGHALFADGCNKADLCREYDVGVMIEDRLETAQELIANEIPVILLDYPWNHTLDHRGITRARGWPEIYRQLATNPSLSQAFMPVLKDLMERAKEGTANAYSPYSGFLVGAALKLLDGRVLTGCNIENASFSLAMCAERTAVYKGVSEGAQPGELVALAIAARPRVGKWLFAPPCGACRQVISQFSHPQFPMIIAIQRDNGSIDTKTLDEYLPYPFTFSGPDSPSN